MAKRIRVITEEKINAWIKNGRGQHHGRDYLPWLTIQDVPSIGLVSRSEGWKTNRIHHFLSNVELSYFLIQEWSDKVIDIREQFPLLPLSKTLEIAERLGIKHPCDPETRQPIVMTTDFLLDVQEGDQVKLYARTTKTFEDINSKRTIDKFEIERTFWQERKVDWGIVCDTDIPKALVKNIDWVYTARQISDYKISENLVSKVEPILFKEIISSVIGLSDAALKVDDLIGVSTGTSLTIVRHLIANKIWEVDMFTEINPSKPIVVSRNQAHGALARTV